MSEFQEIMVSYSNLPSKSDTQLTAMVTTLDTALKNYRADPTNTAKKSSVSSALSTITEYYTQVRSLNKRVRAYLNKSSKKISTAQDTLVSEDRYNNRAHPEESTVSREVMYGIFPKFRESSLPYILATGVFMALMTIFLVLQALGFNGQLTIPQAFLRLFISPAGTVSVPFYKNPMVLGGLVAILTSALIIFMILYFNSKKSNTD
jgi:hypothetical protein